MGPTILMGVYKGGRGWGGKMWREGAITLSARSLNDVAFNNNKTNFSPTLKYPLPYKYFFYKDVTSFQRLDGLFIKKKLFKDLTVETEKVHWIFIQNKKVQIFFIQKNSEKFKT